MTPEQRQSAIDNTRERLEALLELRDLGGYPFERYRDALPEAIVDAVVALTRDTPRFPWPTSFPHPQMLDDDTIERLR